jgi:hypothetical protein
MASGQLEQFITLHYLRYTPFLLRQNSLEQRLAKLKKHTVLLALRVKLWLKSAAQKLPKLYS